MRGIAWLSGIMGVIGLLASPVTAADPNLTGSITVLFSFHPDDAQTPGDQSYWSWSGHSGSLTLSIPSVINTAIKPSVIGPSTLNWSDDNNWIRPPLDWSGLSIGQSGSGSYIATINGGQPTLDVFPFGPDEDAQVSAQVAFTNVSGTGEPVHYPDFFTVTSNLAPSKFNVTIPTGAKVYNNQFSVIVENLTVESGGSMLNELAIVRQNLTNHGSGNFGGTIQGNFINDALTANGDVANAQSLILQGQLQNTGELHAPKGTFELQAATSNAGTLRINGGTFRTLAAFANSGTMAFSAGTLRGPGVVTNNGAFQWTGGTIDNSSGLEGSIVNTSNAFTVSGPGSPHMFGPVTNSGTITQSGGSTLTIGGQTTLANQSGALYDITDDSSIDNGFQGGTFSNAGTFRKSGGTGISNVDSAFTNTGTLQVDTGSVRFRGGGTLNGGAMAVAAGSVAEIASDNNFSLLGTNSASGGGTFRISAGKVIVANSNSASFANFTGGTNLEVTNVGYLEPAAGGTLTLNLTGTSSVQLAGGNIAADGTTINNGNFQWTSGHINGNFTNNSANFMLSGSGGRNLFSGTLTNNGTITQSAGRVDIGSGGTLANQAGALIDLLNDSDIGAGFQSGFVTNAGTLRKSSGSGTSIIGVPFSNTGTVVINSGTLQVNGLTLSSTSTLEIKLSGTTAGQAFGKLFAVPSLAAGGALTVTLDAGFSPSLGNSFDILDWSNTVSGHFHTLTLPALNPGLGWNVDNLYTTGVIAVAAGVPGDYNNNGTVDAADYVLWRKNGPLANEVDTPGTVNGADYMAWRARFGNPGSGSGSFSSAITAIPEPATLVLLMFAAAGRCLQRRRSA